MKESTCPFKSLEVTTIYLSEDRIDEIFGTINTFRTAVSLDHGKNYCKIFFNFENVISIPPNYFNKHINIIEKRFYRIFGNQRLELKFQDRDN